MSKINCPSCNTEFSTDDAPWLKQVEYCPKHDRTRLAGTTCEFCDQELEAQAEEETGDQKPETEVVEETEAQAQTEAETAKTAVMEKWQKRAKKKA